MAGIPAASISKNWVEAHIVDSIQHVHLVCGGRHDFGYPRLELLKLIAEDDRRQVTCAQDFSDIEALENSRLLISYTDNIAPSESQLAALESFIERGGRWLALHATNALLTFQDGPSFEFNNVTYPGPIAPADIAPGFMDLIGCKFIAHLPPTEFTVKPSTKEHPITSGLKPFDTMDEGYFLELAERTEVLLESRYTGTAPEFAARHWDEDVSRPIMTIAERGRGSVVYCTLGHVQGRFQLRPALEEAPVIRCSWGNPDFAELMRRSIAWGCEASNHKAGLAT